MYWNQNENVSDFVVNIVPANGLAPSGTGKAASKFGSRG